MSIKQTVPRGTDDRKKQANWEDDQKRHADPWGVKGSFLLRCQLCGMPSLLHGEPVPVFAVCPLLVSLPGWGHQLPLPVPARRCPDQWPPSPGCSLFSFWFSIHPQALLRHHFVHGCKELKPHPPMLVVREFPRGQRRLDPAAPTLIPGDSTSPVAPLPLPALTSLLVPLLLRLRAPRLSHSPQAHPKSEPVLPRPKSSWVFPNCSGAH